MPLTTRDALDLYKVVSDEEHKALESHQARVAFITGLVSAIFAATIAGIFQAKAVPHYVVLLTGPLLIIGLSWLGIHVSRQFYERFLSAITMRAKLEQALGLTAIPHVGLFSEALNQSTPTESTETRPYWSNEPIVPTRHLKSRAGIPSSSEEWTNAKMREGYHASATLLFRAGITLGCLLFLIIVVFAFRGMKTESPACVSIWAPHLIGPNLALNPDSPQASLRLAS
jgi:hypothetical protein